MTTKKANKKKRIKRTKTDKRQITISVPDDTFIFLKKAAKEDYRSIGKQALMYLDIGIQYVEQVNAMEQQQEQAANEEEPESAIGFAVD